MKIHNFLSFSLLFLTLFSCAGRINGTLSTDGSAVLSINMSLEPRMTAMIRSFGAAMGQTNGSILDAAAIAKSMSAAPGIASVSLKNTSPSAVEGTVQLSKASEFLAAANNGNNQKKFIVFEQGNGGRCEINISRTNGPVILELLSQEIADYLNALMAPIATGENLNKAEYLELVAAMYNKAVSDEIAGSRIRASINFPGSITSVKGGTFSGRRADFDIPLLDLLVLETPFSIEAAWK
jgi:hypothetical protein